ncbi:hypothetical protein GE061_010795 [Apolygus lucorum]|uniref:Nucleoplasmin-like domain-containing protein n=1 Tax=Apolygus lucorum TaxID=248454 RepID=A0A6A4IZ29_APOLU|nr:hypothetical protein GE061_010795 [Apolygus lucorum]
MSSPRNNVVDTKMGTWGMVLKPNRYYRVVFDQPFHLKMAVLCFSGLCQQDYSFGLMLLDNYDDRVPLTMCVLNKHTQQARLDLEFETEDDITFFIKTEAFNKDTNSFAVHLSGKTTRVPDVFSKRPTTLLLNKRNEHLTKSRSGSLPDEYFQKKNLPSPKPVPSPLGSPVRQSATSPAILAPPDAVVEAETIDEPPPLSPKSPKSKDKTVSSFKSGEVFGKIGKFLSKS